MDEAQQKQQFSIAYVRAVATIAGCNAGSYAVDEDSVDMSLRATGVPGRVRRSPQVDVQLKCTAQHVFQGESISFSLKRKNYDDLLGMHYHIPKILILVVVPKNFLRWHAQSEESLVLRRCGYWCSLRGLESTNNRYTVTLKIPRNQIFSAEALRDMMQNIADGKHL